METTKQIVPRYRIEDGHVSRTATSRLAADRMARALSSFGSVIVTKYVEGSYVFLDRYRFGRKG